MAELSPLEFDKATVKEFGITPETEPSVDWQKTFIRAQIDEMQRLSYRTRTDLIHATRLTKSPNEVIAEKARDNVRNGRNDLKQFVGAIETFNQLLKELEA